MTSRLVRRWVVLIATISVAVFIYVQLKLTLDLPSWLRIGQTKDPKIDWASVPPLYPIERLRTLPTTTNEVPKIQHNFPKETTDEKAERLLRRDAVKSAFERSWSTYKEHAWLKDEVMPLTGESRDTFGGWGATLVDSLDTLWIMGMEEEFGVAVTALEKIDFTRPNTESLNVFETTIRYLGGLLAAHDLCEGKFPILLEKAKELGNLLYAAFDTPNRMPVTRWYWTQYALEMPQEASRSTISSEIGSLSLEFTRLSQLTGDAKWYDAIDRISDELEFSQGRTKIAGLWPITVNAKRKYFTDDRAFSMGGMADSLYEYLLKEHLLLGGATKRYQAMYTAAITAAKQHLFFRPMIKDGPEITVAGSARVDGADHINLDAQGQHLACFIGGMLAIGSRAFNKPEDLETARQITDGCVWAYDSMPSGIMPELFRLVPCDPAVKCKWDEDQWYRSVSARYKTANVDDGPNFVRSVSLPPGWTEVTDGRYLLRPEAIESVFVMYRVTGKKEWQDKAWRMFQAIEKATRTEIGYAALANVNTEVPLQVDSCESFWTAETLKYFYLIFSEPDLISLDNYVFNTEAHPLRWRQGPKPSD